jgi:hypothetical protein
MIPMPRIRAAAADFRKSDDGSASIELLFMVPLLSLITFSLVTYFAAFRAQTHATQAATVMTDMVSRETAVITPAYLEGMEGLMKTLVHTDQNPDFRLTAFTYDASNSVYTVAWSKDNGALGPLDDTAINEVSHRLPILKHGQRAILIETSVDYTPLLDIGLGTRVFENFNVAAPRFVPQLCYMLDESANPQTALC